MAFLRRWLRRLGLAWSTVLATLVSVVFSVAITAGLNWLQYGATSANAMFIATVVPLTVAPLFSVVMLRLLLQLEAAQDELYRLSITDELTQAYNRRHFIRLAELEFNRAARYGPPFCVALFDVDDFKHVNDHHGHAAGDAALQAISALCRAAIRHTDVFARYGGEEFALLMPHTPPERGLEVAQRLRHALAQMAVPWQGAELRITVSIGLVAFHVELKNLDHLLQAADTALYDAKEAGKNQIIHRFPPSTAATPSPQSAD